MAPAPADNFPGVYRFEHMQTGARKLRGGSFPADAVLFLVTPSGLKHAPQGVQGLRVGTIRVPQVVVEPSAGEKGMLVLVTRLLAIEPRAAGAARFWFDANGDGDLTNDVVTPDQQAAAFATSNAELEGLLKDHSTGTIHIDGQPRSYVWARHTDSDAQYLFLAATSEGFNWRSAFALHVEVAPALPSGVVVAPGALAGTIRLGTREMPRGHVVIVTPPATQEQDPTLRIDMNADGMLDEAPITLARVAGGADGSMVRWTGTCTFLVSFPSNDASTVLAMDASLDVRPPRPEVDGSTQYTLTYRGEWGRRGTLDLGKGPIRSLLFDEMATGDYRGSQGGNDSGVRLLIDLNNDQKFGRGEAFDPSKPFKAGDATWVVRDLEASGASFRLERQEPERKAVKNAGDAATKPR